MLYTEGSV